MASVPLGTFAVSPQASKVMEEKHHHVHEKDGSDGTPSYEGQTYEEFARDDDKHSRGLPLEIFEHYAKVQREFEDRGDIDGLYAAQQEQKHEKYGNVSDYKLEAQRKLRLANAYVVFFLITTDILGPSNAPYAIAQMGYVPGTILYVIFGLAAAAGGYILNVLYVKVDSNNYPVRTFADLGARVVAPWVRIPLAALQFVQMIMNVGLILLGKGQSLELIMRRSGDTYKLCFAVAVLVWALLGMIIGQIRTLRSFSHIANFAVCINVSICIGTMVAAAKYAPYYDVVLKNGATGPLFETHEIKRFAIAPGSLSSRIGGMNNMVFAWGGAQVFCEIMAELKRPSHFWKGMLAGQSLIMIVYLFFGLFVYSYWGQWVYVTASMSIGEKNLNIGMNVLSLLGSLLAAVLYGNVGLKVLYQGFLVPDFKFPALTTRRGMFAWAVCVVIYWAAAYCIGMGIPSIGALVGLIGAFCILNFSYTFPFIFWLSYMMRHDAAAADNVDIVADRFERVDSWWNPRRWGRGLFGRGTSDSAKRPILKVAVLLLVLACLCLFALCCYAAIEDTIAAYSGTVASAFGCEPPV